MNGNFCEKSINFIVEKWWKYGGKLFLVEERMMNGNFCEKSINFIVENFF